MSELQEKRDYYPDRSLKSIYFVDEQGRKQGNLRKYKENSSEPEYIETYVDNKRTKIAYANGEYETFDENGNILHKKRVKTSYNVISFIDKEIRIDMSYKSGKEWTGTKEVSVSDIGSLIFHEKYKLLAGKKHGEYEFKVNKKRSQGYMIANFDNGVLDGSYKCNIFPPKFLNLKKMGVNPSKIHQLCKKQGIGDMNFGHCDVEGSFNKGVFSGEAKFFSNYYSSGIFSFRYTLTYEVIDNKLAEIKLNDTIIRKYDQGNEIYRLTEDEEINQPLNGKCSKKKIWFEKNKYDRGGEWKDTIIEEWEQKDGKKQGLAKKYNEKGWLESETQYKDGKKHGFEKLYNSDGSIAEMKYWQEGKDCTAKYNKLKKIASKRIEKEKAIEAETGVKTRLPKMSKGAKIAALVKESIGLSK